MSHSTDSKECYPQGGRCNCVTFHDMRWLVISTASMMNSNKKPFNTWYLLRTLYQLKSSKGQDTTDNGVGNAEAAMPHASGPEVDPGQYS